MAFNLDHTASGNLSIAASYAALTGAFSFPVPANPNVPTVFLTDNSASIAAVTGLENCINSLVNCCEAGTAITLNAGNSANNAILVNNDNLIDSSVLPDAVNSCVFVVSNSSQLTLLNQASKGSVAYTTNCYKTYVLTGIFNNINNWVGLLNPDICVDSVNGKTGVVLISGVDLSSSAGYGSNIECAIQCISTGYVDNSCLTCEYKTTLDFANDLTQYSTLSDLSNNLISYPTTGQVSGCLSNYTNNDGTGSLFSPYLLSSLTGDAANVEYNVGTGISCILCIGSLGFIDDSVLPDVSLTESFLISSKDCLTGLTTATIGDVAFDTVNKLNYILVCSGVGAYADTGNWIKFSAEQGSLLNINNHTADPNSTVTLASEDICLVNDPMSLTISDSLVLLDTSVGMIESDYKNSGSFDSELVNYICESLFNQIASGKSNTGHSHLICEITNLDSCISNIPFFEANLINLEKSYSYKLSNSGLAAACGSLILGNDGKARKNYSLVQGAGAFAELGDAQYESVVCKLLPNNSNWSDIIEIPMETSSIALINASFASRAGDAFSLQGAVVRELGSACMPDEAAKSTYSTGNINSDVRVCVNSSGFVLQVKGQTYWTAGVEMVSTKSTGIVSQNLIGLYWNNVNGSNWFNVSDNWFSENTLTTQATSLPSGSSNVSMNGSVAAVVDLDCANWVQPNSINTVAVTDPKGICFTSANNATFSGTIYGAASFGGNASFQ